ncbi:hypothetical protein AB0F91_37660 [Amycolatopsis sp. NPDC023774]|uniref:hypothetical protein n=1 Tax=Amycolatopsis sp. NPDC023774 TaxID=3155015 RepID=UPI0034098047
MVPVSGKVYSDLLARAGANVALVRLEQFDPLPQEELTRVLSRYPNAEMVWAQEEPKNQGAGSFLRGELGLPAGKRLTVVSRRAAASPPTGSHHRQPSAPEGTGRRGAEGVRTLRLGPRGGSGCLRGRSRQRFRIAAFSLVSPVITRPS